jgi:hypothetical protein
MKLGLLQVESVQSEDSYTKAEDEQQLLSKQKMVAKDLEFEQGLLIEREQVIKQIENDILDVNQIMRELGAMVHLQSDTISNTLNLFVNLIVSLYLFKLIFFLFIFFLNYRFYRGLY